MRKKTYKSPIIGKIEISTIGMLASSKLPVGGGTGSFDSKKFDSDWNNIWK
jgi:hypothetical protein